MLQDGRIAVKKLPRWKRLDDFRARLAEAQGAFAPELLNQVFLELASEIPTSWGDAGLAHLADKLKLVDGTLAPISCACTVGWPWNVGKGGKWIRSLGHELCRSTSGDPFPRSVRGRCQTSALLRSARYSDNGRNESGLLRSFFKNAMSSASSRRSSSS